MATPAIKGIDALVKAIRDGNGAFNGESFYLPLVQKYEAEVLAMRKKMERYAIENSAMINPPSWFMPGEYQEKKMADKMLFTVFQGTNGFYAKLANGSTVIGATMQELCAAAQAETVSARIGESEVEAGEVVQEKKKLWSQFMK